MGSQSTINATIVGVQQKTLIGSTTSYINTVLANRLFNYQSEGLPIQTANQFSVLVATFTNSLNNQQITTLKNNLKNIGYTAETTKDMVNTVFTVINAIIIVFDIFGGIALLAATFGIVNTLFMAVQERTKEIGLMKALGMNPHRIFLLFSLEAILIGLWGSVLGVLLADLIGLFVNNIASHGFLKDFTGLHLLSFPLATSLIIIIIICVIAFLAGTLPALRASRKDPIEALRYE
jgi:putative ABC transport system permease protein